MDPTVNIVENSNKRRKNMFEQEDIMDKNPVAKILYYIGIVGIVIGIIAGFIWIIAAEGEPEGWAIGVAIILGCFLEGMVFIGLSEIIDLLQRNFEQQKELANQLLSQGSSNTGNRATPKSVIEDIEANLPRL